MDSRLTNILTEEQINKANNWNKNHYWQVDALINCTESQYPPSTEEDKNNPILWKSEHWRWFLNSPVKSKIKFKINLSTLLTLLSFKK